MPTGRRHWWRWGILLLVVIAALLVLRWLVRPKAVAVTHPVEKTVVQALTVSGQMTGRQTSVLATDTPGILSELLVHNGQSVRAGQLVGRIASGVQTAQLAQAIAGIRVAHAQLEQALRQRDIVVAQLQQARADATNAIAQAQARLTTAREALAQSLNAGTSAQRQQAAAAVQQAEINVAQARLDVQHAAALASTNAVATAPLLQAQSSLAAANAAVQRTRAVAANAEITYARQQSLYLQGAVSRAQRDTALTAAQTAEQDVQTALAQQAQATTEVANQQQLLTITRTQALERAQSNLAATEQALTAAQAAQRIVIEPLRPEMLAQQRAEVTASERNLTETMASQQEHLQQIERTPVAATIAQARGQLLVSQRAVDVARAQLILRDIFSPYTGVISQILAYPGDVIGTNQAVVRLTAMGLPQALVNVDERDIALIKVGQRGILIEDTFPDRSIPAHVVLVGAYADPQLGTVEVRLSPDRSDARLRDGATVDATIITQEARPHLLIPLTAVNRTGYHGVVMVIVNGRVEQRPIYLGASSPDGVVVLSGLTKDDLVVLDPLRVTPGERVRPEIQQSGK